MTSQGPQAEPQLIFCKDYDDVCAAMKRAWPKK